MYGCLLCAHFTLFRSALPGETHSILCDHAGVSLIIYLVSLPFSVLKPMWAQRPQETHFYMNFCF